MAAGDVVNTANRLESAAPRDGILVGEETYRATAAVIEYAPARAGPGEGQVGSRCGFGRRSGGTGPLSDRRSCTPSWAAGTGVRETQEVWRYVVRDRNRPSQR